jgi:hypothetical protein
LVRFAPAAAVLLGFSLLRCAAQETSGEGSGGTLGVGSGGRQGTIIDIIGIGWPGGTNGGLDELDPRCGEAECSPDDVSACEPSPTAQGGAGGEGGGPAYGGSAGLSANPGDLGKEEASCQVTLASADCEGQGCDRVATCMPTGTQPADASCLSPADCGPGLACVDVGATVGVCKPYCCEGGDSCAGDTYCSAAPLLGEPEIEVPVCAPLDDCSLADPYPCPEDGECTCTGDLACVVVRPDGRTACAEPGRGTAGDDCDGLTSGDCAHGFVCSPNLGCLGVCRTEGGEPTCAEGQLCQSPSGFPITLGVCVGPTGPTPAP